MIVGLGGDNRSIINTQLTLIKSGARRVSILSFVLCHAIWYLTGSCEGLVEANAAENKVRIDQDKGNQVPK